MAHDHHHHHDGESMSSYFTEQLLTILVCGLLGFAAIQMYRTDRLGFLAEQFRTPVLYGGIGVLALVVLRSVAVWKEAGEMQAHLQACAQDHVHTDECNHPHAHDHGHAHGPDQEHDHGHSHDMSWVFARMLILIFPVALFFLGLPSATLGQTHLNKLLGKDDALGGAMLKEQAKDAQVLEEKKQENGTIIRLLKTKSGLTIREIVPATPGESVLELVSGEGSTMRFNELNDAALDDGKRENLNGKTAILEGRFKKLADKEFSLFRLKMTCCAADTVPLKVRIIVPQALSGYQDFDWVTVKGQLQFVKVPGQDRYIPVVMVADIRDVRKTEAKNEYEQ